MTAGTVVTAPDGTEITLVDIGQQVLLDNDVVRVWEVVLGPGETQPWHLHHNPYVVLSVEASPGRMDWLDGAEPRFLDEYAGGSVYRPTSPVHRLTNIGDSRYVNRLVEFKDLGEKRPDGADSLDIGPGARSVEGQRPGPDMPDGRRPVLVHEHTTVWEVEVPGGGTVTLDLGDAAYALATISGPRAPEDATGGTSFHDASTGGDGSLTLTNDGDGSLTWFVVELTYLSDPSLRVEATDTTAGATT